MQLYTPTHGTVNMLISPTSTHTHTHQLREFTQPTEVMVLLFTTSDT